ncbi:MAG: hypothetical protein GWP19_08085, partial [Planctomycetia bacterium]|nr:hypothetical protein [Planctomycetia bacterium]
CTIYDILTIKRNKTMTTIATTLKHMISLSESLLQELDLISSDEDRKINIDFDETARNNISTAKFILKNDTTNKALKEALNYIKEMDGEFDYKGSETHLHQLVRTAIV